MDPRTFLIRSDFDVFFTSRDMADQAFRYFDKDNDQRLSLREMKVGVPSVWQSNTEVHPQRCLGPCSLAPSPGPMQVSSRRWVVEVQADGWLQDHKRLRHSLAAVSHFVHIAAPGPQDSVVAIFKERKNMASSLKDTDSIVHTLEFGIGCVFHFLFFAVYLLVWNVDIMKGFDTFSATVLALTFVFGNSVRWAPHTAGLLLMHRCSACFLTQATQWTRAVAPAYASDGLIHL